jgi:hypothetical protein
MEYGQQVFKEGVGEMAKEIRRRTPTHAEKTMDFFSVRRRPVGVDQRFMFLLSRKEFDNLRLQFATSNWGGRRERRQKDQGSQLAAVYSIVKSLIEITPRPAGQIGFRIVD